MAATFMAGFVLATTLAFLFVRSRLQSKAADTLPLPPGPKGLPFIGNIKDLPPPGAAEFQHRLQHKERYGSLNSVTVLGQTMIIVHDKNVAFELMERRASRYSGRPSMKFGIEICGWGAILAFRPYGPWHRLHRKYIHQQLSSRGIISNYDVLQEAAVKHFLWRSMRDEGQNLVQHLHTEAAELIMSIVYGYNIEPHGRDDLVDAVVLAMKQFSEACVPGKWAVDMFPFLEHMPEWLPGTGFKRTARNFRKTLMEIVELP